MRSFWSAWPELQKEISLNRKIIFLFDFDGTLVPIAQTPDRVVVPKKILQCLNKLSRSKGRRVCVVSGRSLKDLKSFLHIRNVVYAGNHGLRISGHSLGTSLHIKNAKKIERTMKLVYQKLHNAFLNWPGILIEDKTYAVAVHYRKLPKERGAIFKEILGFYLEKFKSYPLIQKKGKKVLELRPRYSWNKGDATRFLTGKFKSFFPIVIGDDLTDEDMFRVVEPKGVTIRVGRSQTSSAKYFLRSQKDVPILLEKLCP